MYKYIALLACNLLVLLASNEMSILGYWINGCAVGAVLIALAVEWHENHKDASERSEKYDDISD